MLWVGAGSFCPARYPTVFVRVLQNAWLCLVLLLGGCIAGYRPALSSPDPAARIRAIRQGVEKQDRGAVPLLVNRLEDEDEAVRFYAITALVKMTGSDQGYRFYAPESERREAVKRWRRHIEKGPTGPTTMSASGSKAAPVARASRP
jgi:hypothetical protein